MISRRSFVVFAGSLFFLCLVVSAGRETHAETGPGRIDALVESAIRHGLISGGVVAIGNSRGELFCRAYGRLWGAVDAPPVQPDTIFDIASLTKVVATTPAILNLAEEGKLSLLDPVARWFPEFAGMGKEPILILHLLTHTSGLRDLSVHPPSPLQSVIDGSARLLETASPGLHFKYVDLNFILLGELVRRATGEGLDRYASDHLYGPLKMADTGFNPGQGNLNRMAATLDAGLNPVVGHVQDPTARILGGVAGHAGLFSTARDLAVFCRMMLNNGSTDGRRVLSERAVRQMTAPYLPFDGKAVRGLGWDISSPFSCPRGEAFSELSFGHTGYSGSSIWIDPASNLYVVLLTARLDYRNKKEFNRLRGSLSTTAARIFCGHPEITRFMSKSE
jgi:CubicO group peptidase (beta-lactamase class C family)